MPAARLSLASGCRCPQPCVPSCCLAWALPATQRRVPSHCDHMGARRGTMEGAAPMAAPSALCSPPVAAHEITAIVGALLCLSFCSHLGRGEAGVLSQGATELKPIPCCCCCCSLACFSRSTRPVTACVTLFMVTAASSPSCAQAQLPTVSCSMTHAAAGPPLRASSTPAPPLLTQMLPQHTARCAGSA